MQYNITTHTQTNVGHHFTCEYYIYANNIVYVWIYLCVTYPHQHANSLLGNMQRQNIFTCREIIKPNFINN